MPILKPSRSHAATKNAVVLDLGDLDQQARRIIDRAREEAASILASAQREAAAAGSEAEEVGRAEGLQNGLAEGIAQGRQQGREAVLAEFKPRIEQILQSWESALEQWEKDRSDMLLAARQDVLTLALEFGRKVVGRTIECDPSVVQDQLREALALLSRRTSVVISVHPEDRTILEEVLPGMLERSVHCTHARVRDDPDISRGGCIVRTDNGEIDATIDAQLQAIVEALLPADRANGGARS